MIALTVNGKRYEADVEAEVPLLWVLREHLGLTGTKFGCGAGICGSCTVHIDGRASRSCQTPVGAVVGKTITTIEGLPADHPVKKAWVAGEVVQCGYCQPGQIMQAAALFAEDGRPSEEKIVKAMDRNLCRCGTYPRIRAALTKLAREGGAP
jgi:isoquinoline 1-oxidoreductase alpha subunit